MSPANAMASLSPEVQRSMNLTFSREAFLAAYKDPAIERVPLDVRNTLLGALCAYVFETDEVDAGSDTTASSDFVVTHDDAMAAAEAVDPQLRYLLAASNRPVSNVPVEIRAESIKIRAHVGRFSLQAAMLDVVVELLEESFPLEPGPYDDVVLVAEPEPLPVS